MNRLHRQRALAGNAAWAACTASLIVAPGCAVDQQREVQQYREVLDRGLTDSPASQGEAPGDQPDSPDPRALLTLRQALLLANSNSERLAIEGEEYLQSIIARRRAAAVFLPTITLAPSYTLRDQTSGGGGGGGFGGAGAGGGSQSALDVPLRGGLAFNPASDLAGVDAAGENIRVSLALLRDAQDALLIDVARTFYEVLRAERQVVVLENSLQVQEERVRDARGRQEAGVVRPLDVALSESQAATTRVLLTEARTDVQNARTLLAFLAAHPIGERTLDDSLTAPDDGRGLDAWQAHADAGRQDVLAAAAAIDAAGHLVRAAYGQYFPAISIDAAWFLSRESEPTDLDWTSIIQVSLPLFSAGLIEADVRESLSILRQTKLSYSLTRRQAHADVATAHANFMASAIRVADLGVSVDAAADALEQSEGLYRVGLATNLERLEAQDRLLSAQLDLTNAQYDRKVFYLDLLRTSGGLHEVIGIDRDDVDRLAREDAR